MLNIIDFFAVLIYNFRGGEKMTFCKWIEKNTKDLSGKTVAVTGSTGGLGIELCDLLARLGARLVFLDRTMIRVLPMPKNF